jgi:hypothetical protein
MGVRTLGPQKPYYSGYGENSECYDENDKASGQRGFGQWDRWAEGSKQYPGHER